MPAYSLSEARVRISDAVWLAIQDEFSRDPLLEVRENWKIGIDTSNNTFAIKETDGERLLQFSFSNQLCVVPYPGDMVSNKMKSWRYICFKYETVEMLKEWMEEFVRLN